MAPSNFVISPCVPEDVDEMVTVYWEAFRDDYFTTFVLPSTIPESVLREWATKRFLGQLSKPEIRCWKITDTETGKLAAWTRWGFPYKFTEEAKAARAEEKKANASYAWPAGANFELCDLKFGALDRIRDRNVDFENDYLCYLLQTAPAYQRKGLGKMIMSYGLALADAEGRKCHIEATPNGHPLYLKLGFRDIDLVSVDLTPWGGEEGRPGINRVMVRDPRPLNTETEM